MAWTRKARAARARLAQLVGELGGHRSYALNSASSVWELYR